MAGLAISIEDFKDETMLGTDVEPSTQTDLFGLQESLMSEDVMQTIPNECEPFTLNTVGNALFEGSTLEGRSIKFMPRRKPPSLLRSNQKERRYATNFYQMLQKIETIRLSTAVASPETHYCFEEKETILWVDKYRPRRFTDLLAFEKSNIEVLQWVTQWRQNIREAMAPVKKRSRVAMSARETEEESIIPPGLPEQRILLINGPPGLGKTTLVQLVGKAADFEVVEINASDERSGDIVLSKINAALTSDSIKDGRRPNLLLIDEIDGAVANGDKSLIGHLIKLATGHLKNAGVKNDGHEGEEDDLGEEADVGKSNKKDKKKSRSINLLRPIICVCNDLYAPSLRQLRQIAKIVSLRKPSPTALASRLREICLQEGIQAEGKALLELSDMMDCDIRASLHALQFIARQKTKLTLKRLSQAISGLKDVHKTPLSIYESIFHADPRIRSDPSSLVASVADHGEFLKLAMGVFEIYPQCKFHDDTRHSKVRYALDWLEFVDHFEFAEDRLSHYAPFAFLKIHRLFAGPVKPSFRYPREDYELYLARQANVQHLMSYRSRLPVSSQSHLPQVSDIVLRLCNILPTISHPFRVASVQLLKHEEKKRLREIVELMLAEGLTYKQIKREDGTYEFVLDP